MKPAPNDHPAEKTRNPPNYMAFYLPLVAVGWLLLTGRQLQNRTLAGYPDAERHLATYAVAFTTFMLFHMALGFTSQMANVLVRSIDSYRRCRRFVINASLLLSVPVAFLGYTDPGAQILCSVFGVKDSICEPVVHYLRWFLPVLITSALGQFYSGLLVQAQRTGLVTVLQALRIAAMAVVLAIGDALGADPVPTLSLSLVVPAAVHFLLAYILFRRYWKPPEEKENIPLTFSAIWTFFWPMALTSVMFAFSRPILFAFMGRLDDAETAIAAVSVAFNFALFFHDPLNEFRHLYITFGPEHPRAVNRFMVRVSFVVEMLMLTFAATPLLMIYFRDAINVQGKTLEWAVESFWPVCLIPIVLAFRNALHGRALIERRTGGMGAGGVARNIAIYFAAFGCWKFGVLTHVTATAILVLGFVAETLTVFVALRWLARPAKAPALSPAED